MSASSVPAVALGLYQIGRLLSRYVGHHVVADPAVRQAACLARALQNEALTLMGEDDRPFDPQALLRRLDEVDGQLGSSFVQAFEPLFADKADSG